MDFQDKWAAAEQAATQYGDRSFVIKDGVGGVLVSAPHCVEQWRNGAVKFAEPQTGVLAELLHAEWGCPIIRKCANLGDDANYDPVSDYKDALVDYVRRNDIRFVMDLHQMACEREILINFGTGNGKNLSDPALLQVFDTAFRRRWPDGILLDTLFSGGYPHTVSSTVSRACGIPCLQIEINSRLLREGYGDYAPEEVYAALATCCAEIRKKVNG